MLVCEVSVCLTCSSYIGVSYVTESLALAETPFRRVSSLIHQFPRKDLVGGTLISNASLIFPVAHVLRWARNFDYFQWILARVDTHSVRTSAYLGLIACTLCVAFCLRRSRFAAHPDLQELATTVFGSGLFCTYGVVTEALVAVLHGSDLITCIRTLLGTGRDCHALIV